MAGGRWGFISVFLLFTTGKLRRMSGWFQFQSLYCATNFRMTLKDACIISLIIWNSQMCREWRRWLNEALPVSPVTSKPCCSQSELHFRIIFLSLRTLVKLGRSVGSSLCAWPPPPTSAASCWQTHQSLPVQSLLRHILAGLSWWRLLTGAVC